MQNQAATGITHASPQVLMEESNLLRALPKGGGGARELMQMVRRMDPGVQAIQQVYPGYQHGVTRLSRHARKRLGDLMQGTTTPQTHKQTMDLLTRSNESVNLAFRRRAKGLPQSHMNLGPIQTGQPGQKNLLHSGIHPQAQLTGGSTSAIMEHYMPGSTAHLGGRGKEILNRVGILHEGIEAKALRGQGSIGDMVRGWGRMPYQTPPPPLPKPQVLSRPLKQSIRPRQIDFSKGRSRW